MVVELKLHDFVFTDTEIPSSVNFGGEQHLVVHDLIGGTRIVDAMGDSMDPITWSGLFMGDKALSRAKYLDMLRVKGAPVVLTWDGLRYSVVIQKFQPNYNRHYKIPYSITVVVIADLCKPVTNLEVISVNKLVEINTKRADEVVDDMNDEEDTENGINLPVIKSMWSALRDQLNLIRNFVKATQAQIRNVRNNIRDMQDEVTRQIASVSNTIQDVTTLGGILPNNPVSINAGKLMASVRSANAATQLMELKYTLAHTDKHLKRVEQSKPSAVVAIVNVIGGSTLYQLATTYYKDASKWEAIAKVNSVKDPFITESMTLIIPRETDV